MQFVHVKHIVENPNALRRGVDQKVTARLVASIRSMGMLNPSMVRAMPRKGWFWFFKAQKYMVLDGWHRFVAARIVGLQKVPCQIFKGSEKQLLEAQIIASSPRVATTPAQYAKAIAAIINGNPGMAIEELAEKLGKSAEWVKKYYKE